MSRISESVERLTPAQRVERLTLVLEGAGLGIWDWDPRDDSVAFDRRWCEMLGLDPDHTPMHLSTWEARVHPDDLARCFADIAAHMGGETAAYENVHRLRHANGEWVSVHARGRVVERDAEGRPSRFTGVHLDVTATERAERVLAEQGRQFEALVRDYPAPVAMLDRSLRFVAASARWLHARGVALEEILGRPHTDVFPVEAARWAPVFARALEGESLAQAEESVQREDGSTAWLRWAVCPWHEVGGGVAGVIALAEDVTDQVSRREAQDHKSRYASLGLVAAGVAHEINTPLQVITLEAEELEAQVASGHVDAEAVRACTAAILATTRRAREVVQTMRTLARGSNGVAPRSVRLADVVQGVVALAHQRAMQVNARLDTSGVEPSLRVVAAESDVAQVLLNLVQNALDAVDGQPERWVALRAEPEGERVVLRCEDSGPGVPRELQPRLMQPFFTTRPHGTGLGLSISRALAARLGGQLDFEPGGPRTTFALRIPRAAEAPRAAVANPA